MTFYPLTEEEIAEYVALGESRGRAGPTASKASAWCWSSPSRGLPNIVGLPVAETIRRLHKLLGD